MKTSVTRLILLGALGAGGFWAWGLIFPSPEHVIRNQLADLARTASISPNQGALTRLANVQKLANFFSADARITVDVPGRSLQTFSGRDEILNAVGYARSMFNVLKVEFVDVLVQVGADKQSALVQLTASANLPGEKIPEVQELEVNFKNTDHGWLINRIQTVKTLR
jgi:hypothetical protein